MKGIAFAAGAIVSLVGFCDLPQAPAPLARSEVRRQPVRMIVSQEIYPGWKHTRVEYRSGTKSLLVSGVFGQHPWEQFVRFGKMKVVDGRDSRADLVLTCGEGSEWCIGKSDMLNSDLRVDEKAGRAIWSRRYDLPDGTEATMSYATSLLPDGRIAIDCDLGVTEAQARAQAKPLPVYVRMNLESREDGTFAYGFGDEERELKPREQMLAAHETQVGRPLRDPKDTVFNYEKRDPAHHWLLEFPSALMRRFSWIEYAGGIRDGKVMRSAMIYSGGGAGDFRGGSGNPVRFRFILDLGESPVAEVEPAPPVGGIDFWALDGLHVPEPPMRNLVMNGSFEQDFKGWRWDDWGAVYSPAEKLREEIVEGGRFGRHALLLRGTQPSCPALCSAPMALVAGRKYTVSCWAKSLTGAKAHFGFRVRSVNKRGKYYQFKGMGDFPSQVAGKDWERKSFTFEADAGGFWVQLGAPGGAENGVLIDGIQVEEGEAAMDFAEAPFVANLLTSDPHNDLRPGEVIDARLDVQAFGGATGGVRVRVKDGYSAWRYDRTFPLAGDAVLPLDLDAAALGKGIFVIRLDYESAGRRWTDYTRFSVQAPLANRHPTAQMYANHGWFYRSSRAPHYVEKFVEWGWGSMDGRINRDSLDNPIAKRARELGIRNYVHPVAYEDDELRTACTNLPSGTRVAFKGCRSLTGRPEELELFEETAYRTALRCLPEDDLWTFWNEEESWAKGLGEKGFETQWAFNAAIQRGVRRAFAERGLPPPRFSESHGTSHYFNGRNYDTVEGYLRTALAHGFRYDVFNVHPYSNIDGGILGPHDADVETKHLLDELGRFGYPDTTPVMFTECFNMQPWRFPSWSCDGWGDDYRKNTTPTHDMGVREFVMAASQMRLYILALKYWPRVQLVHPWNREPIIDLRFTPLLFTFSANTLGHLLPAPEFVGDAQPYGDVRGYCFRQGGKAVMPVWSTNHDLEFGMRRSAVVEMELPADATFVDMFGNVREPAAGEVLAGGATKTVRVPLTPAPLFIVAADADALLRALREAVADDPSTAFRTDVRPDLSGRLSLELENLTKSDRKGELMVGGRRIVYAVGPRATERYPLAEGGTEPMRLQSWRGMISPLTPTPWDAKWFFVPRCGERPDWDSIPAMPLSTVKGQAQKGFSASCKYAWNPDFLFIRVEVEDPHYSDPKTDGKFYDPRALYAHDGCLEVYFDGFGDARSQGTKGYDLNDSRYDLLGTDVHRLKAVNWQLAQGTASATDAEIKEKLVRTFTRTVKGYFYELAFAARYMAPVDLKPGTVAGTGLCLHDIWKDADGKEHHTCVSNATIPGFDLDRKPYLQPLMVLSAEAQFQSVTDRCH